MVTGMAWAYHVGIRRRDLGGDPLTGAGAWMPRVYLYGATLTGLIFTAYNIGTLLGAGVAATTGRVIRGRLRLSRPSGRPPSRSPGSSAGASSGWVTGDPRPPSRTVPAGGPNRSVPRVCGWPTYVAAIGSMALATAHLRFRGAERCHQARGPSAQMRWPQANDVTEAIAKPLVSLIPWAASWWLHRTWLIGEARGVPMIPCEWQLPSA